MNFSLTDYYRVFEKSDDWKLVSSLFTPDPPEIPGRSQESWCADNFDLHPAREIMLVLEGSTLFSLNHKIFPATSGTIFLFDAYEKHIKAYPPDKDKSLHLWLYLVSRRIIVHVLSIEKGKLESVQPGIILENSSLYDTLDQGWSSLRNSNLNENLKKQKIKSLLSLVFLEFLELDMSNQKLESANEFHQEQIMLMISRHIANTAGKGLSVEKLAKMAGYSQFHFLRTFKKHIGQNVQECINAARLKRANELRLQGYLQKEMAEQLGFSSPSAFSNWLHKRNFAPQKK